MCCAFISPRNVHYTYFLDSPTKSRTFQFPAYLSIKHKVSSTRVEDGAMAFDSFFTVVDLDSHKTVGACT